MQLINQNFARKFYEIMLVVLAFSLPIHYRLVAFLIMLIGLFWIVEFNFMAKFKRLKEVRLNRQMLSFGFFYLMYVVGAFYSENLFEQYIGAYSNLEEKLSLLVFPLLFSTIPLAKMRQKTFNQIKQAFVLGCIISSVYLLGNATYTYMQSGDVLEFYYGGLSEFHHAGYLALYFSVAIAIVLNDLLFTVDLIQRNRIFKWISILFLQLMIVLLSSKAGILGIIMIYGGSFIFVFFFIKKRSNNPWLPLLFLGSFLLTEFLFPQSFQRFYSLEKTLDEHPTVQANQAESTVARMLIWNSALELIAENPLWGVGTGDIKDELIEKYKENEIKPAFEQKLNAHNQYLQTYLGIGLIGFLLLMGSLIIPAWFAFKKRHLLYLSFLMLIILHMLVESILEKQAGVVFYAFINMLFFYMSFSKSSVGQLTEV